MRKVALRDQLVTVRSRRSLLESTEAARAIATHVLAADEVRRAASVAAYVGIGHEPLTGPLLDGLVAAGKRVILPVMLPDGDLDWAAYDGPDALVPAVRGLLEPASPRLGVDAIATPDVVLTPGLAVDRKGMRLGRGGGSYDRALSRVPVGTFVCTLLFEGELLDTVPSDPHDQRVSAVATPSGLTRLGAG
ncbi:5-formyltetrahydrofolate cyclo-ligase [soil metagenome]